MTFNIAPATMNAVANNEKRIAGLNGDIKANRDLANSVKLDAYAELICALRSVKLVKGNLPRAVSKTVKQALLQEAGVKEATAKRYLENSVGAIRHFDLGKIDNATPTLIKEFFEAENIDSENKLAKAVNGSDEVSKAQKLAEAVVGKWSKAKDDNGNSVQGNVFKDGLDDDELEEFEKIMSELMIARETYRNDMAAKAAQAEATAINDAVAASVKAMTA